MDFFLKSIINFLDIVIVSFFTGFSAYFFIYKIIYNSNPTKKNKAKRLSYEYGILYFTLYCLFKL